MTPLYQTQEALRVALEELETGGIEAYIGLAPGVRAARTLMGQRIGAEVTARIRRAQGTVDRFGRIGRDPPWLTRFMVNAFIRPSDRYRIWRMSCQDLRRMNTRYWTQIPAPIPAATLAYTIQA